jgi:hypothetical protein
VREQWAGRVAKWRVPAVSRHSFFTLFAVHFRDEAPERPGLIAREAAQLSSEARLAG